MNYRPARWIPPATRATPVVCDVCGVEHFSVFYISETLGISQCEACLRTHASPTSVSPK
ncbi:hypothetical protein [Nitrospira sp. M1]